MSAPQRSEEVAMSQAQAVHESPMSFSDIPSYDERLASCSLEPLPPHLQKIDKDIEKISERDKRRWQLEDREMPAGENHNALYVEGLERDQQLQAFREEAEKSLKSGNSFFTCEHDPEYRRFQEVGLMWVFDEDQETWWVDRDTNPDTMILGHSLVEAAARRKCGSGLHCGLAGTWIDDFKAGARMDFEASKAERTGRGARRRARPPSEAASSSNGDEAKKAPAIAPAHISCRPADKTGRFVQKRVIVLGTGREGEEYIGQAGVKETRNVLAYEYESSEVPDLSSERTVVHLVAAAWATRSRLAIGDMVKARMERDLRIKAERKNAAKREREADTADDETTAPPSKRARLADEEQNLNPEAGQAATVVDKSGSLSSQSIAAPVDSGVAADPETDEAAAALLALSAVPSGKRIRKRKRAAPVSKASTRAVELPELLQEDLRRMFDEGSDLNEDVVPPAPKKRGKQHRSSNSDEAAPHSKWTSARATPESSSTDLPTQTSTVEDCVSTGVQSKAAPRTDVAKAYRQAPKVEASPSESAGSTAPKKSRIVKLGVASKPLADIVKAQVDKEGSAIHSESKRKRGRGKPAKKTAAPAPGKEAAASRIQKRPRSRPAKAAAVAIAAAAAIEDAAPSSTEQSRSVRIQKDPTDSKRFKIFFSKAKGTGAQKRAATGGPDLEGSDSGLTTSGLVALPAGPALPAPDDQPSRKRRRNLEDEIHEMTPRGRVEGEEDNPDQA